MAHECARILQRMGCEVRIFDPSGLQVKNEVNVNHPQVQELRQLRNCSDAQSAAVVRIMLGDILTSAQ